MPFPWLAPAPQGFLWPAGAALVMIPLLLRFQAASFSRRGAAIRAGKLSREYATRRAQLMIKTSIAILVLATGGIGTLVLWAALWTPGAIPIGSCLCLWGLVGVVPLLLYVLLLNRVVNPLFYVQIRGLPRPTPEATSNRAKGWVLRLGLPLLFIEALGLCYWPGAPGARWVLPVIAVLLCGLRRYWSVPIGRRVIRAAPIEKTPWAALEPRIHAWAARAGVQVSAIGIRQAGTASVARNGRRGSVIFLNARLLEQMDWRQQDAIVSHELGHLRLGHLRSNTLAEMLIVGVQTTCCVALNLAAPPEWLRSMARSMALTSDPMLQIIQADLLLLALCLLALALTSIRFWDRARRYRSELACDRFSAELTGDPLAMMVALNTIRITRAIPPKQRSMTHPPIEQRILTLAAYLREQRPAAPWARTLVPSKIPFILKQKSFTVPLDQAPPLGAVNDAPENIVSSVT